MTEDSSGSRPTATSYVEIIKSTSIIGISTGINISLSVLRMKAFAVLLGPGGVGLFGLYNLVLDLAAGVAGMGLQSSGVRQVAEAAGAGDQARIARVGLVLGWVSLGVGFLAGGLLAALAFPVSVLTFGDSTAALGVALLGGAVLLRLMAGAPTVLIQGMRRIGDLARMTVIGALANTVVAVPVIYVLREDGIVPSLIAMTLTTLLAALWYRAKITLPRVTLSFAQARFEARALVTLGLAFMASALLTLGAAYAIRIFVLQRNGVEAAGLYQAAWAVGGLYAGFILQAMGTDFYPRLTAIASDNPACNRLVNEQAQVSILLAGPGLIGTMTFAPLVIAVFYSAEFLPAVSLLRWLCLGMLLRIVAWPMGFIILAKGAQRIFLWTEIAATVVHVGLAWILLQLIGLAGAGMAFVGLYVWHGLLIYVLVRRLSGFRWTRFNLRIGSVFLIAAVVVLAAVSMLPFWIGTIVGGACTALACIYSAIALSEVLPQRWFPPAVRSWIARRAARRAVPAE